jgi:hypothetical protein
MRMGKYFEFDRKIGWVQLIAILALILSIASLWITTSKSRAQIIITHDTAIGSTFFDPATKRWRILSYDRVIFSNTGGSPMTLIGIRPMNDQVFAGMVAATIKDGRAVQIPSEIFITDKFLEEIEKNTDLLSVSKEWSLERLGALHRIVPAGGTLVLNVGILVDAYNGIKPVATDVLVNLECYFSDGTKQPYQFALGVPPPPVTAQIR